MRRDVLPTGSGLFWQITFTSTDQHHGSLSGPPSARALGRRSTGEDRYPRSLSSILFLQDEVTIRGKQNLQNNFVKVFNSPK